MQPFELPIHASYEFGVGGGGGMDVGEGLIHQSTIGTRISLSQKFDITIDIGRMKGVDGGSFAANVLQVGVSF